MAFLHSGEVVDRYVVQALLGQGGMAAVYQVQHSTLGTQHALKVLTLPSRKVRERMVLEGRVQSALDHPNVLSVHDVVEVRGSIGLLMDLVEGPSLAEWLEDYQPPLDEALAVFRGMALGVGHAHGAGLIHRDLKPGNVLLAFDRRGLVPKVTDFGLVKALGVDASHRTRTGAAMGTPGYMAPEQIEDASSVDRRADTWALGCVLYRMVCGEEAFQGNNLAKLFRTVLEGTFVDPHAHVPDLPDRVVQLIQALLSVDPVARPADIGAMVGFLDGDVDELVAPGVELGALEPVDEAHSDAPCLLAKTSPGYIAARDYARTRADTRTPLPTLVRGTATFDEASLTSATAHPTVLAPEPVAGTVVPPSEAPGSSEGADIAPAAIPAPAAPSRRGPVLWLAFGVVGVLLVAGVALGGSVVVAGLAGRGEAVAPQPVPTVAPAPRAEPPPLAEPVPATDPLPIEPDPAPVPVEAPAPARPAPAPAPVAPKPEPAAEPVAPPEPAPEPAPAPARPAVAELSVEGADSVWFEHTRTGDIVRGTTLSAGRWKVHAVFGGQKAAAGEIKVEAGRSYVLDCKPAFRQCSLLPR